MSTPHLDAYLEVISDRRRRRIIQQLREETTEETTVENLVHLLHDDEVPSSAGEYSNRNELSMQLLHKHLPKLDDHGLIHYDRENGVVRYRSDEQVETILDALPGEAPRAPSDS